MQRIRSTREPAGTVVHVPLLDEGIPVWRPVPAVALGGTLYRLAADPAPEDESWEFPPGSVVRCDQHTFSGESTAALRAVEAVGSRSLSTWLPGRHVHVGVDVLSHPLWEDGTNVSTDTYALTDELAARLDEWAEQFNVIFDRRQQGIGTGELDEWSEFDAAGLELSESLARELGEGFIVHFDSMRRGESDAVFDGATGDQIIGPE